jgi:hypothetical protein
MAKHTHHALVLLLLATACAAVPPAKPASERSIASSTSLVASAAPSATPAVPAQKLEVPANSSPTSASSANIEAGASAPASPPSSQPPSQAPATPTAAESNTVPPPFKSKRPTFWYCYIWAHLRFTTQDCFDTIKECRANIPKGEGMVLRPCMAQKKPSWCTEPHHVPEDSKEARSEKCFGSADDCEQYRAYVQGNGLESTPCVEVAAK